MLSLEIWPNEVSVGVATQNDIECDISLLFINTENPTTAHDLVDVQPGPQYLESSVTVLTKLHEMSKLAKYALPKPARTPTPQDSHS